MSQMELNNLRKAAAETANVKEGKWFYFNYDGVEYFKKLDTSTDARDKRLKAVLLGLIDASLKNNHEHQAAKIMDYYGMPEYEGLHLNKDELIKAGREGALIGLRRFNLDKAKKLGRKGEVQVAKSYVLFDSKHEMIDLVLEKAQSRYPAMSAYYQQLLVLAHKGGIADNVADHSVDEVVAALNTAAEENHEKTVAKREKQGRPYGAGMFFTRRQAEGLLKCLNESKTFGRRGAGLKTERIGEVYRHIATNQDCTITDYRGIHDVDVKLADGTILTGINYYAVKNGTFKIPGAVKCTGYVKRRDLKKKDFRKGEVFTHKRTGQKITVVSYNDSHNVDVQFEDGTVVRGCEYRAAKNGTVKYPKH